MVNRR